MKKLSVLLSAALLTMGSASAATVIIDSFSDTQSVTASGAAPQTASAGIAAAGAIGGNRNVTSNITSGNGSAVSNINNGASGKYEFSLTAGENGTFQLIYDGDGDNAVNATGLGGVDLTSLGTNNGIAINMASDLVGPVTMTVYTDAANYSTYLFNTPGGNVPQNLFLLFTAFTPTGLGADFTDVGAITLFVNANTGLPTRGLDGNIDFIQATNNNVPEPASMMMIGSGLTGLALFIRRRRQNA